MNKTMNINQIQYKNQILIIERELDEKYINSYRPLPSKEEFPAKIVYVENSDRAEFYTIRDFSEYITKQSIDIISIAKEKTYDFAVFLSCFLELGRVITNHPLYKDLKQQYNLHDLASDSPIINNNEIVFFTYSSSLKNNLKPLLLEVRCSLNNFEYRKKEILK